MALPEHVRVSVALDDPEGAPPGSRRRAAAAGRVGVLVEMDVGMGRVGVPEASGVVELARLVAELGPGLRWRGVLFYPGHIRVPARRRTALLRRGGPAPRGGALRPGSGRARPRS
jgi:D-serine deaminase-like pyridoxal phosphate-dependent protein